MTAQTPNTFRAGPDERGHFGLYGGRYVAETLMPLILEVEQAWNAARADKGKAARGRADKGPQEGPDQDTQRVYEKGQPRERGLAPEPGRRRCLSPFPAETGTGTALRFEPVPVSASAPPSRTPSDPHRLARGPPGPMAALDP